MAAYIYTFGCVRWTLIGPNPTPVKCKIINIEKPKAKFGFDCKKFSRLNSLKMGDVCTFTMLPGITMATLTIQ